MIGLCRKVICFHKRGVPGQIEGTASGEKKIFILNTLKPVHTVAEECDCRRIRRQSHFSATVSLFSDNVDRALQEQLVINWEW